MMMTMGKPGICSQVQASESCGSRAGPHQVCPNANMLQWQKLRLCCISMLHSFTAKPQPESQRASLQLIQPPDLGMLLLPVDCAHWPEGLAHCVSPAYLL
eukprot:jgi/Ulvmu1/9855/UM057_0009.1